MSGLDDTLPDPPQEGGGFFGDPAPLPAPKPAEATAAPYRVLARKYRPSSFDDLIGQEAMVRILRRAFAQGRIAHAWMLTGVRGVGKTTTARIIARALNCIGPTGKAAPPPTRAASAPTVSPSWPTGIPTWSRWTPPATPASTTCAR